MLVLVMVMMATGPWLSPHLGEQSVCAHLAYRSHHASPAAPDPVCPRVRIANGVRFVGFRWPTMEARSTPHPEARAVPPVAWVLAMNPIRCWSAKSVHQRMFQTRPLSWAIGPSSRRHRVQRPATVSSSAGASRESLDMPARRSIDCAHPQATAAWTGCRPSRRTSSGCSGIARPRRARASRSPGDGRHAVIAAPRPRALACPLRCVSVGPARHILQSHGADAPCTAQRWGP